jgi:Asp-tRNA(Asn)/Glu-tRNA(Gln) amidotransferase A subunit family amidase
MLDNDNDTAIQVLRELGVSLVGVQLPERYPLDALLNILDVESAAMFDEMLRDGDTEGWNRWPNVFRAIYFTSAVDYVRMQRLRLQLMRDFDRSIAGVDFLCNMSDLQHTNLTGHPSVVLPSVIELDNGRFRPRTIVLTGHTYDDDRLLTFAAAMEERVKGGLEHPPMERWLGELTAGPREPSEAAE